MISFAITVNNELNDLQSLINSIEPYIWDEDEVVILHDWKDDEVHHQIKTICSGIKNVNYVQGKLSDDFSQFKNQMIDICTKKWIVHFDADESPHRTLMENLRYILDNNENVDVIRVPRINKVNGITDEHIKRWGWNVNEYGWINFPDYQERIWKNKPEIQWNGKVHERLTGFKTVAHFPMVDDYCYYHIKDIKKQEGQNKFYETID